MSARYGWSSSRCGLRAAAAPIRAMASPRVCFALMGLAAHVCLASDPPRQVLSGAAEYLAGHEAEENVPPRWAEALKAFEQCVKQSPELAPYARVRIALCRARGGDVDGGIAALRALVDEAPRRGGHPAAMMAKAELGRLLHQQGRSAEALPLLRDVLDHAVRTKGIEPYEWTMGDCLLANPATAEEGHALFERLLRESRRRDERLAAARRLAASARIDHRLLAADTMVNHGEFGEARNVLLGVAPDRGGLIGTGETHQARVAYLNARIVLGLQRDKQAGRAALLQVADAHPGTEWERKALLHVMRSAYASADEIESSKRKDDVARRERWIAAGRAAFDRLIKQGPSSEETGDALWWLANRAVEKENHDEARARCLQLAAACPQHPRADDALYRAAGLFEREGKFDDALTAYSNLLATRPESELAAAAAFRRGWIHEKAQRLEEAAVEYRHAIALGGVGEFYSHRAADRLDEFGEEGFRFAVNLRVDGSRSFVQPLRAGTLGSRIELGHGQLGPEWARLRFFAENGFAELDWEALALLTSVEPAAAGADPGDLYIALAENGAAALVDRVLRRSNWGLEAGRPTVQRLRALYPLAYWEQASGVGKETGIDPLLLLAMARQESVFQPRIESHAGARGLMQVMPATADWLAKVEPAVSADHAHDWHRPEYSLRMGAYYMVRMIERSGGNLVYAIASYNAGPGNVSKWQRRFPNAGLDEFIDSIPFEETRDFVRKVLGNYAAYHSLYAADDLLAAVTTR